MKRTASPSELPWFEVSRERRTSETSCAHVSGARRNQTLVILVTDEILTRVPASCDYYGDAPVLVQHRFGEVACDRRLIVGMWRDDEDVRLESFVGWWIRRRLLR